MAKFEGYERRIKQIEACLNEYGISSLDDCKALCESKGIDVDAIVKGVQPIAFDNATWAYTLGVAIALKKGVTNAAEAAETIGIGLQAFCIPGSVAESRKVGLGHGNLAAMLLREETKCFCFLAGHESFAAAEGAIGIARTANKVRKEPLRVRRRYGQNAAPRQRRGRSRLLWPDRFDGQNAWRCAVRRLILRSCTRRDDGLDRHG